MYTDRLRNLAALVVLIIFSPVAAGKFYTGNPDNYRHQLRNLRPGDQLLLTPGFYQRGLPIHHLRGEAHAPIIITGLESGKRAVFLGRRGHNTVSIIDAQHVILRNIEIDGQHLPVDGVKCEGHANWAHHITLENLLIHRHDHNQQIVGISTKCPAWNWTIRHNIIQGAGTGIYLGSSDGSAPFIAGLIEYNLITQTLGYNLQIKHQQPRPNLAGMPAGDQVTTIRHNVFSKADPPRNPSSPRPNVLLGHWPLMGRGANDRYLVYSNFFYQNPQESLFQGEGRIALYNNLFVNHMGGAIRFQPHHDKPREIAIFFNTVVAKNTGIYHAGHNDPSLPIPWIANNAVFANRPLAVPRTGDTNFSALYHAADKWLIAPFAPLGQMNLAPCTDKLARSSIDKYQVKFFPEWELDFSGHSDDSRFGAYAYDYSPGWLPILSIKSCRADNIRNRHLCFAH